MAKVLIIDDDIHVTGLLQSHLTDQGFQVTVAHLAADGLAQAMSGSPDLIMLDVMLPDATGFQVCSRLRQNEATKEVPIIMMTGVAHNANQQLFALQRGANEYLHKPLQVIEVGDIVQAYIGRKKDSTESPRPAASSIPQPTEIKPSGLAGDLTALRTYLRKAISHSKPKK